MSVVCEFLNSETRQCSAAFCSVAGELFVCRSAVARRAVEMKRRRRRQQLATPDGQKMNVLCSAGATGGRTSSGQLKKTIIRVVFGLRRVTR
jgi:hypothetical protein